MLNHYGEKAVAESVARADELAAVNDHHGAATWRRRLDAKDNGYRSNAAALSKVGRHTPTKHCIVARKRASFGAS